MSTPPVAPTPSVADQLRQFFNDQKVAQDTGLFQVIGLVDRIWTTHGPLEFQDKRFALAITLPKRDQTTEAILRPGGQVICIGPWPGAQPVETAVLASQCPECLVDCEQCKKTGYCVCSVCGGTGIARYNQKVCPDCAGNPNVGKYDANCKTCSGTGQTREPEVCQNCEFGKMKCVPCLNTGRRSSGYKAGTDMTKIGAMTLSEPCAKCKGKQRMLESKPQDLKPHVDRETEEYTLIGPVESFLLHREGFDARNGLVTVDSRPNSQGYPMMLVIEKKQDSPIYVLNGELDLKAFVDQHGARYG